MVDVHFDGDEGTFACEGCGTEIPVFLDACPYCSDDDDEADSQAETEAPCPECGALIYDDSERCAVCGSWISMRLSTGNSGNRKMVLIVVVLLVVSILYLTIVKQ